MISQECSVEKIFMTTFNDSRTGIESPTIVE